MADTRIDTSRITLGEMVAAAAAGALVIVMLLPWFSVDVEAAPGLDLDGNAWQTLGYTDVVMFLAAMAVIAIVVVKAIEPDALRELPWQPANVVLGAAALCVLLISYRLISPPELEIVQFSGIDVATKREPGLLLGFAASLAMLAGGWLQRREP